MSSINRRGRPAKHAAILDLVKSLREMGSPLRAVEYGDIKIFFEPSAEVSAPIFNSLRETRWGEETEFNREELAANLRASEMEAEAELAWSTDK